jgi:branched-chain amino acid transport system permease protein
LAWLREWRFVRIGIVIVVAAIACILPSAVQSYLIHELTLALAYAVACLGLKLTTGYTGQMSLGHAFFIAAGAYFTAWLVGTAHMNFLLALPIAVIVRRSAYSAFWGS